MNESGNRVQYFNVPQFKDSDDFKMFIIISANVDTMFVNYNTLFADASTFKKYTFNPDLRYGEDLEHLLRTVLIENVTFNHIHTHLIGYRIHPGMVTAQKRQDIHRNNLDIIKSLFGGYVIC